MKYSDATRRQLVSKAAKPTPRSEGRKLDFTVSLYKAGHGALNTMPRTLPVLGNNDDELIDQFTSIIRLMRQELNSATPA